VVAEESFAGFSPIKTDFDLHRITWLYSMATQTLLKTIYDLVSQHVPNELVEISPEEGYECITDIIVKKLKAEKITPGMHGDQLTPYMRNNEKLVIEWLLGQYYDIVTKKAFHAVNQWINITRQLYPALENQ
jgi:hypothetical protein